MSFVQDQGRVRFVDHQLSSRHQLVEQQLSTLRVPFVDVLLRLPACVHIVLHKGTVLVIDPSLSHSQRFLPFPVYQTLPDAPSCM